MQSYTLMYYMLRKKERLIAVGSLPPGVGKGPKFMRSRYSTAGLDFLGHYSVNSGQCVFTGDLPSEEEVRLPTWRGTWKRSHTQSSHPMQCTCTRMGVGAHTG